MQTLRVCSLVRVGYNKSVVDEITNDAGAAEIQSAQNPPAVEPQSDESAVQSPPATEIPQTGSLAATSNEDAGNGAPPQPIATDDDTQSRAGGHVAVPLLGLIAQVVIHDDECAHGVPGFREVWRMCATRMTLSMIA